MTTAQTSAIESMLTAFDVPVNKRVGAMAILTNGLVTQTQAANIAHVSVRTVKRLVTAHGIRRVTRQWAGGSLVDLAAVIEAAKAE